MTERNADERLDGVGDRLDSARDQLDATRGEIHETNDRLQDLGVEAREVADTATEQTARRDDDDRVSGSDEHLDPWPGAEKWNEKRGADWKGPEPADFGVDRDRNRR